MHKAPDGKPCDCQDQIPQQGPDEVRFAQWKQAQLLARYVANEYRIRHGIPVKNSEINLRE